MITCLSCDYCSQPIRLQSVHTAIQVSLMAQGACKVIGQYGMLQLRGIRVPRVVVQELLREIDPEGTELRRAHRLRRRRYHNPGPNYAWHCDGYDKLKPSCVLS